MIGLLLFAWILSWISGAARALVFMKGWEWFVADTFGAPELGFVQSWGIVLLSAFAVTHLNTNKDDKPATVASVVGATIGSLIVSGIFFASMIILAGFR